jgi:hypothetical protein
MAGGWCTRRFLASDGRTTPPPSTRPSGAKLEPPEHRQPRLATEPRSSTCSATSAGNRQSKPQKKSPDSTRLGLGAQEGAHDAAVR